MKKISVKEGNRIPFHNNSSYCVGTGRMGLALQREYYEQLKMAQEVAGFRFIRGHGLFCDDMGICKTWKDWDGNIHEGWNFTYLDRVMDMYREVNIRPFLELGFMPSQMASGTQTIFYWKGNTTPPKDDNKWTEMIRVTLRHLADRYGEDEVSSWPCEVWNEPNLPGFWENADRGKYFHLYEITVKAVKETLPQMKVGGPAVCGGPTSMEWIREFLAFCRDRKLPMDFLTRHAYMGNDPEHKARYLYHTMREIDTLMEEMTASRAILDSFPEYKGKEMYITEFNTSYNPFCPIHDTNLNAAYTAGLLARLGDVAAGYSYWTFGDVFEEGGVPARPFHGGFGMIANGLIAKPTLWTFAFFNKLKGECVYRDENAVIMRRADGSYEGILWNLCREKREELELEISLPGDGEWSAVIRTTDEECCNPLKVWHEMGEPESLRKDQTEILRQAGTPLIRSQRVKADGILNIRITLGINGVTHFLAEKSPIMSEEGYEYDWYLQHS